MKNMSLWRKKIKIELCLEEIKSLVFRETPTQWTALLMRKLIYVERSLLFGTRL